MLLLYQFSPGPSPYLVISINIPKPIIAQNKSIGHQTRKARIALSRYKALKAALARKKQKCHNASINPHTRYGKAHATTQSKTKSKTTNQPTPPKKTRPCGTKTKMASGTCVHTGISIGTTIYFTQLKPVQNHDNTSHQKIVFDTHSPKPTDITGFAIELARDSNISHLKEIADQLPPLVFPHHIEVAHPGGETIYRLSIRDIPTLAQAYRIKPTL